jgi:hypothetical protein
MANNELPKAQLGAIVKIAKGAYQGMKTGYKSYKAASLAEKAAKLKKAQTLARTQKAAATRAANAKAAAKKPGTTKTGTTKTSTTSTTKTKDPFVKSKARLATENVVGKVVGGAPFYTVNAAKKILKNPIAQGIAGTGTTLYVANRYAKTNAPKKVKKYKKK